jgi:hypothetical protein
MCGTGAPLPDREGTFQLFEFFGEAIVPIVQDHPHDEHVSPTPRTRPHP